MTDKFVLEYWYVLGLLTWAPVSADLFCLCVQWHGCACSCSI